MTLFERIHVKGFRRLADVDLPLRPLCVLIGANGSGKTSLLDVFSLLAASAAGNLKTALSDMHGMAANLTADGTPQMSFDLAMNLPGQEPLVYELTLVAAGVAYEIAEEKLYQKRVRPSFVFHSQSGHRDIRFNALTTKSKAEFKPAAKRVVKSGGEPEPLETCLAQFATFSSKSQEFQQRLRSSTHYHVLNVEPRSPVRLPQPLQPATLPGANGEDLVSCLFNLRETDRDRFDAIEDTLRAGFRGFERLDFPPVAAGTLAMTWRDKNYSRPLYMNQLSEGTLRFLWLVTLLQSPGLTAVTLIDEPEVSLHPELLSLLADLMREASSRTQLIVATHADRLVRFLKPSEVVAMDTHDDGTVAATWADQFDLEAWLKDYTLDEVWRMGRMGARS